MVSKRVVTINIIGNDFNVIKYEIDIFLFLFHVFHFNLHPRFRLKKDVLSRNKNSTDIPVCQVERKMALPSVGEEIVASDRLELRPVGLRVSSNVLQNDIYSWC